MCYVEVVKWWRGFDLDCFWRGDFFFKIHDTNLQGSGGGGESREKPGQRSVTVSSFVYDMSKLLLGDDVAQMSRCPDAGNRSRCYHDECY